jgi:peptide/nickel transport system permease protein
MRRIVRLLSKLYDGKLSPSAKVGLVMLAIFVAAGIFGPLIAPYDPAHIDLGARFQGFTSAHWLGTDSKGADALSQLLYGARSALIVSVSVVSISSVVGIADGTMSGWFRGRTDELNMRLIDILMSFPGILLNIAIVALMERPGLGVMIGALSVNGWVGYARIARGEVLALRERDYVAAAVAVGASDVRVMFRHLVPNLMGPALVQMTFGFGSVILVEASLSFLGLGPQVDYTWGSMLEQGTTFLWKSGFHTYALLPGLAIMWVVLGANLLGDGLRDRLDPRQRGRT